ncbi:hypothetical protein Tco_0931701 [Tanacetum coccineum]
MEKSSFDRYNPSVHEVMQHLLSELTGRSNRGQLVLTSLRRSELQHDLYIPRYEVCAKAGLGKFSKRIVDSWVYFHEILRPSSVFNSMAVHLKNLGFVAGSVEHIFVRDKKKNDDDFVAIEHLNEYSSVAETRRTKLQLEVGSASMSRSKYKRKRFTPRKRWFEAE